MATMDVKLYVYDLSRGMARAMSEAFLGIQIDAVYHTSLVFGDVEYLFGAGVQTCDPGSSHHGNPMEVISLGETHLPLEDILEYLDSLKEIYTPESYDLFTHNCNNFTNDFATFLVGKGIPDHITSLPQTVLNTPFGQMLRPQLDASMRMVTQAPVRPPTAASSRNGNGVAQVATSTPPPDENRGKVRVVTSQDQIDELLKVAKSTYAVIFFTSGAYPPCEEVGPTFVELAAERPDDILIKIDIDQAPDVATRYHVKATPTFQPYIKGRKGKPWTGTDVAQLRKKVSKLDQQAHPAHSHTTVKVPSFTHGDRRPVLFGKTPPLDKVTAKMGEPSASDPRVKALVTFLDARTAKGASEAPLPDLAALAQWLQSAPSSLKPDVLFTAYDLFRCAMVDPRICGFFVEETPSNPSGPKTLSALLTHVKTQIENDSCPYSLQLVALQLCNNIFSSSLGIKVILLPDSKLAATIASICTSTLTAEDAQDPNGGPGNKPALKAAAANLAFNLTTANYKVRVDEDREALAELLQLELCAAILEFLQQMAKVHKEGDESGTEDGSAGGPSPVDHEEDQNHESALACLLALGYLLYHSPRTAEVWDLTRTMDARHVVQRVAGADEELANVKADVCRLMAAH